MFDKDYSNIFPTVSLFQTLSKSIGNIQCQTENSIKDVSYVANNNLTIYIVIDILELLMSVIGIIAVIIGIIVMIKIKVFHWSVIRLVIASSTIYTLIVVMRIIIMVNVWMLGTTACKWEGSYCILIRRDNNFKICIDF